MRNDALFYGLFFWEGNGMLIQKAFAATSAVSGSSSLPLQGTQVAAQWDQLYWFLVLLSAFFFVLVVGGMIYLAFRYRKAQSPKSSYITGSHALEIFWTAVPTVLLLAIFAWGWSVYTKMVQAPGDAYEIRVVARKWVWQFQYPDGRINSEELVVPVDRPIKLIMSSEDVVHSFFVPNFRIKQDVVPGMYTTVWFEATIPGKHQIFCTEYCGASHSLMLGKVVALPDDQWKAWLQGKKLPANIPAAGIGGIAMPVAPVTVAANAKTSGLALEGKALTQAKGCVACHSDDGTIKVGPSYKGIFGNTVEHVDGSKSTVDENYIRESIENPNAKIVKNFQPLMPPFKGLLTEAELNAIIAYIKSVK
jgi:cytochrome c oxidase subunit 2